MHEKSPQRQALEQRLVALYKDYLQLKEIINPLTPALKASYASIRHQIIQYFKTLYDS